MSTSGTVDQTTISTAKIIEHALRRCGIQASQQIPETVYAATECLFLLLTHLANKGLNLWCIEQRFIGYVPSQRDYLLPAGTNDVLNVLHVTTQLVQDSPAAVANVQDLGGTHKVCRVGVKFSVLPITDFTVETSTDGVLYASRVSAKLLDLRAVDQVYWYALDPSVECAHLRVSSGIAEFIYAATAVTELPVTPFNRDTYASLPNKYLESQTVTNYLFNKTLSPTVTTWPVPTSATQHMTLWVHRQIQDVGTLSQTLAIPKRWYEATIIQLAARLALELPGVAPDRITLLLGLADKFEAESYSEETDSAPMNLSPRISAYTR